MDVAQLVVSAAAPGERTVVTVAPPVAERDQRYPLRGRGEMVEELLQLCAGRSDGRMHVLHGISGSGKTAIALEVVHRLSEAGPRRVWWVDARHAATFVAGMRVVARHTGLGEDDISEAAADALWERLNASTRPWLLIVDNAEDLTVLNGPGRLAAGTGWLRPHACAEGMVVVVTRYGVARWWGGAAVLHPVGPLPPDDAAQVLLDHAGAGAGTLQAARALGMRLGGLPLALSMAGSYLAEVNTMPEALREAGMPSDFAAYHRVMNKHGSSLNPARVIAHAWQMSVELLHQMGFAHAGRLLTVLAAFNEAPIPYTLLLRPARMSAVLPGFGDLDGTTLWRTLRELAALGLTDPLDLSATNGGLPCVRLHPLIRDIARAETTTAVTLIEQALRLDEVRLAPEDPKSWSVWAALTPHALDLLQHAGEGQPQLSASQRTVCADAAELAARYLQTQGLFAQARRGFERVLTIRSEVLGPDHVETVTTRHNLASILHDLGALHEAEPLRRHVWHCLDRICGTDHHDTLIARHELGRLLHDMGRLNGAEAHLRYVYRARLRTGGEQGSDTLAARHELARVLHDRGDLEAAREEYQALLTIRLQQFGEDHPRTATIRHNHACVLHDLGLMQLAHDECRRVLASRTGLYGFCHPKTLATAHLLAIVLEALSRSTEALQMLKQVCDSARQLLGADHPQTRRYTRALAAFPQGSPGEEE
ncbi:tetratricopeptide repeat protein [Streptomyces sp. NPDC048594]|uniref:tetratricopeptide repeat protein n=1 Tax=Streptomyces sp. NPDC048594 TaxID=3365575 RepID=UPI0037117EA0